MEKDLLVDRSIVSNAVKPLFVEYDKMFNATSLCDHAFKAMEIVNVISAHYEKVIKALIDRINMHEQESGRILVELVAIKDQGNRVLTDTAKIQELLKKGE